MNFSLIIPCYNEAQNLPTMLAATTAVFDRADIDYELVFVNDGSSDSTAEVLEHEISSYLEYGLGRATVRVVEFSRNFGKEAAMYAGMERASGDVIGFIDADMQQDPAVALEMYLFLVDNPSYDCVAAVQDRRKESLPLRACKRLFYRAFNDVCNTQIPADASDFRVFRRPVADALLSMKEHNRFSKGLFAWVGFRTHIITYQVRERLSGESKWRVRDLFSYAWNGVVAFSTWPLKMVMCSGLVLALVTLACFAFDVCDKMFNNSDLSTSQLLLYVVLLMGGVQMVVMGIFGEYMARAYIEVKGRPLFVERSERVFVSKASQQRVGTRASKAYGRSEARSDQDLQLYEIEIPVPAAKQGRSRKAVGSRHA